LQAPPALDARLTALGREHRIADRDEWPAQHALSAADIVVPAIVFFVRNLIARR
jgi:hypothetical protein